MDTFDAIEQRKNEAEQRWLRVPIHSVSCFEDAMVQTLGDCAGHNKTSHTHTHTNSHSARVSHTMLSLSHTAARAATQLYVTRHGTPLGATGAQTLFEQAAPQQ